MSGISIGITRSGSGVQISLHCGGDYHAIEVYDRLVEAAKKGQITIDLETKPRVWPPTPSVMPKPIEIADG
jgi:hypothetical protein